VIRAAAPGDAAEVARLSLQLGDAGDAAIIAARMARMASLPTHALLVDGDGDGRLAGYVAVEHRLLLVGAERVEIVALVVDAARRRDGRGRRLVEAAESWARGRGAGEVFLRSNVLRSEAHAFYPALGYARRKTQHAYARALD
jgi:GNAT superfamily N-acetyltransferase